MSKVKSTVGTNFISQKLTAPEVCAILEAASKGDVRVLKFAGLYVAFGPGPVRAPRSGQEALSPSRLARQEQIMEKSLAQQEMAAKKQTISELVITDPAMLEDLLAQGELIPDGSSGDEEFDGGQD